MPKILFSEYNQASNTLAHALIEQGYEKTSATTWKKESTELINTKSSSIIDIPTEFDTDYLLVLSSHKSKNEQHALTAHFPGNWNRADFGGAPRTLNVAYASKLKHIMQSLVKENEKEGTKWEITLEADHHGPTCSLPIIYVEIGTTEKEWTNKEGASIVARALEDAIRNTKIFRTIFAVGGGHYPLEFNKIEFENLDIAIGHMLPKHHIQSLNEDIFKQAIEKNIETVKEVWVLKESTNVKQRNIIKELAEKYDIEYVLF